MGHKLIALKALLEDTREKILYEVNYERIMELKATLEDTTKAI